MASAITPLMLFSTCATSHLQPLSSPSPLPFLPPTSLASAACKTRFSRLLELQSHRNILPVPKSSPENDGIVAADNEGEDGVSLGTFKLPGNTDLQRFETLLFQWANSLCQGANLPLPMPLKVDKISGGARLGFITIEDGKTEVLVYIDCLVFPATSDSGPIFRAVRNGPLKDAPPPVMKLQIELRPENRGDDYDAIVVGSGYGGSVAACRMSTAGIKVCLHEKGRRWKAEDFPTDRWKIMSAVRYENRNLGIRFGPEDALFQEDSLAAVACGLGGGSLVNAGVMLPTPTRARRNPKWPKEWEMDWAENSKQFSQIFLWQKSWEK
ncbi:hypothetical protein OIU78_002296 [Salix suchowensis]|nr:hypothetical protein OIU78_002296 [Salix suchowensis]